MLPEEQKEEKYYLHNDLQKGCFIKADIGSLWKGLFAVMRRPCIFVFEFFEIWE